MQSRQYSFSPFKNTLWEACIAAGFFLAQEIRAAELSTLFTTPQERQIINTNRYKTDKVTRTPEKASGPEQIRALVKEEVKKTFLISGITISNEGHHSVWINGQVYQDGERIEGKSKVRVMTGKKIRVRITAPDGKHYFGTSGETVEVKYLEASDS